LSFDTPVAAAVPEPGSISLLLAPLLGFLYFRIERARDLR